MKDKHGLGECIIYNEKRRKVLTVNDEGNAVVKGMRKQGC